MVIILPWGQSGFIPAGGGAWTQQGSKLVGAGNIGASIDQGGAVSMSADGSTAMVGGPGDNSFVGAAWVYVVEVLSNYLF